MSGSGWENRPIEKKSKVRKQNCPVTGFLMQGGREGERREKEKTFEGDNYFQELVLIVVGSGRFGVCGADWQKFSKELYCSLEPKFHKAEAWKLRQESVP